MDGGLAGVVLAAGAGTRLRPLTLLRPKVLCPVGNVPLIDLALARLGSVGSVAVNVHHGRAMLDAHLDPGVHRSYEESLLGTAGALGQLRGWLDGRAALVVNGDAWCPGALDDFVAGWDGERVRLLLAGDDELQPRSGVAAALMPWSELSRLEATPSGLYEVSWRAAQSERRLDVARLDTPFIDCGTPAQYLAANLAATAGKSAIGEGAEVDGKVEQCVVWPGAEVRQPENLFRAIRANARVTVYVR